MKRFIITYLSAFVLIPPAQAQSTSTATSIPLGLAERVSTFYTYAIGLGALVALGVIIYGGLAYSASAGNPGRIEEAKKWIQHAIFGLILLFSSFIILNFINPDLTTLDELLIEQNPEVLESEISAFEKVKIREFGAMMGRIADEYGGYGSAELPSGTTQELARQILSHPNINLSSDARRDTFERIANGQPALVPAINSTTNVDNRLMQLMLAAANAGHRYEVLGVTTRPHSSNSQHYKGQAVDILKNDSLYAWFFRERSTLSVSSLIHNFAGEVPCTRYGRTPTGRRPTGSYNLFGGQRGNMDTDCHDQHIHISVGSGGSGSGSSGSGGGSTAPFLPPPCEPGKPC